MKWKYLSILPHLPLTLRTCHSDYLSLTNPIDVSRPQACNTYIKFLIFMKEVSLFLHHETRTSVLLIWSPTLYPLHKIGDWQQYWIWCLYVTVLPCFDFLTNSLYNFLFLQAVINKQISSYFFLSSLMKVFLYFFGCCCA